MPFRWFSCLNSPILSVKTCFFHPESQTSGQILFFSDCLKIAYEICCFLVPPLNLRVPPPMPPSQRNKALLRDHFLGGGWHWSGGCPSHDDRFPSWGQRQQMIWCLSMLSSKPQQLQALKEECFSPWTESIFYSKQEETEIHPKISRLYINMFKRL